MKTVSEEWLDGFRYGTQTMANLLTQVFCNAVCRRSNLQQTEQECGGCEKRERLLKLLKEEATRRNKTAEEFTKKHLQNKKDIEER